jgi:hypothetical protein
MPPCRFELINCKNSLKSCGNRIAIHHPSQKFQGLESGLRCLRMPKGPLVGVVGQRRERHDGLIQTVGAKQWIQGMSSCIVHTTILPRPIAFVIRISPFELFNPHAVIPFVNAMNAVSRLISSSLKSVSLWPD